MWRALRVAVGQLTTVISLPAAFRNALVHLSLRGLRLALKALWHLERQKQNFCTHSRRRAVTRCRRGVRTHAEGCGHSYLCVVSYKSDPSARVHRCRANVAGLDAHDLPAQKRAVGEGKNRQSLRVRTTTPQTGHEHGGTSPRRLQAGRTGSFSLFVVGPRNAKKPGGHRLFW